MLSVGGFLPNSLVNGAGIRAVIFFQGCKRNCPGCQNKHLQADKCENTMYMTPSEIIEMVLESKDMIDGITLSGGDPLYQDINDLIVLCVGLKKHNLNIWLYTGEIFEKIPTTLLNYIDVVVDGPFVQALHNVTLKYRGSSNQRIIHLKNGDLDFIEYPEAEGKN